MSFTHFRREFIKFQGLKKSQINNIFIHKNTKFDLISQTFGDIWVMRKNVKTLIVKLLFLPSIGQSLVSKIANAWQFFFFFFCTSVENCSNSEEQTEKLRSLFSPEALALALS